MHSSYSKNKFDNIFKTITFLIRPSKIVEFGILEGFSLSCFLSARPSNCQIDACDIFEDFSYHAANYESVINRFSHIDNLNIKKLNFYEGHKFYKPESIDILHIDIANDGDVFEFAFENYMDTLSPKGVCLLEGGSKERDNYYWMLQFKKRSIIPVIELYKDRLSIFVIEDFPSLSIVSKS